MQSALELPAAQGSESTNTTLWDGTKEKEEFKPKSGYILSPVSHQLQRNPYTIQSRWCLARPQGLLWQGMVLLGVGSSKVRLQQWEARPGKCIPTASFQEVLAGSPGKGLSCTLSAQLPGGHSHCRQQFARTHTKTHTTTHNYVISEQYVFPSLRRNEIFCTAVHVALHSSVFPNGRLVI